MKLAKKLFTIIISFTFVLVLCNCSKKVEKDDFDRFKEYYGDTCTSCNIDIQMVTTIGEESTSISGRMSIDGKKIYYDLTAYGETMKMYLDASGTDMKYYLYDNDNQKWSIETLDISMEAMIASLQQSSSSSSINKSDFKYENGVYVYKGLLINMVTINEYTLDIEDGGKTATMNMDIVSEGIRVQSYMKFSGVGDVSITLPSVE